MTIEVLILDAVLAKFDAVNNDGVVYPTTTRLRGLASGEIPPGQFPHVQVHSPAITSETIDNIQKERTLEFTLVLRDTTDPTDLHAVADAMRTGLSALSDSFREDPTLGGLVTDIHLTSSVVFDTLPNEDEVAQATIEATLRPEEMFSAIEGDVDVLPWIDDIDLIDTFLSLGQVQLSQLVPGGAELEKFNTGFAAETMDFGPKGDNGLFPIGDTIDLVKLTRFLRFAVYITPDASVEPPIPDASAHVVEMELELYTAVDPDERWRFDLPDVRYGWNEFKIDLDDRTTGSGVGGPFDFSVDTIVHVRMRFRFQSASSTSQALDDKHIIKVYRLFHRQDDLR